MNIENSFRDIVVCVRTMLIRIQVVIGKQCRFYRAFQSQSIQDTGQPLCQPLTKLVLKVSNVEAHVRFF